MVTQRVSIRMIRPLELIQTIIYREASIIQGYPSLFCMKGSKEAQHTETRSFSTLRCGGTCSHDIHSLEGQQTVSYQKLKPMQNIPKNLKFEDVFVDY